MKELERLTERYMEGLTTPEEQTRLRRLLEADDLPEAFLPYREMFRLVDEPMEPVTEAELEAFAEENGLETVRPQAGKPATRLRMRSWFRYAGIAASFVLVFFAGRWSAGGERKVITGDLSTYDDLAFYDDPFAETEEEKPAVEVAFEACESQMDEFEENYINPYSYEAL